MPTETQTSSVDREQLLDAILGRAQTDQDFRSGLLNEPRAVIFDAFGVAIPENYRIRFIERGPDVDALVVLPDFSGDGELSDDDLDCVNGGTDGPPGGGPW